MMMTLLPVLLTSPDLVFEVQVVVPLLKVMDPLGPGDDQSPDQIGLVGVVATDGVLSYFWRALYVAKI